MCVEGVCVCVIDVGKGDRQWTFVCLWSCNDVLVLGTIYIFRS